MNGAAPQEKRGTLAALWRRAPVWRLAFGCAVLFSLSYALVLRAPPTAAPTAATAPGIVAPAKVAGSESSASGGAPTQSPDSAYDGKPSTVHATGKWYFEVNVDIGRVARIMPTTFAIGLADLSNRQNFSLVGTMTNIQAQDADRGIESYGIAADLDHGKIYVSKNGSWTSGAPGSDQGAEIKPGRDYHATFLVSAKQANQQYLDSGAIVPNFGDRPLQYDVPEGYLPWRASEPPLATAAAAAAARPASDPIAGVSDEEEAQARCHPHLRSAPAFLPPIDASAISDPRAAHLKVEFWVNGAGVVVRERLVAGNLGSAAERAADLAYTRELTFSVPQTAECQAREMELFGDFFLKQKPDQSWVPLVRLYPRLALDQNGVLLRAD